MRKKITKAYDLKGSYYNFNCFYRYYFERGILSTNKTTELHDKQHTSVLLVFINPFFIYIVLF